MINKMPNVLLIIMDSVRASHLSCYGYLRETSPVIDRIAREGVLYEKAISVSSWTLPVHGSLFTGLYPSTHGLMVSKDALPDDLPTLATQLKSQGYQTASFSNNPYISDITKLTKGFDRVEDLWRVSKPHGIERKKISKIKEKLERFGSPAEPLIWMISYLQRIRSIWKRRKNEQDNGAHLANEKIASWLQEVWDRSKPFFIYVNYMETHEPYNPPSSYQRRFMPKRYSPLRVARVGNQESILKRNARRRLQDLEILRALYDGEIGYLDSKIGELLDFIDSMGIMDETVIIITSDHGDSLGEHNQIGHRVALYDELLHVPLVIRYKPYFPSGTRIGQQVSLIDLYPTILELSGVNLNQNSPNAFFNLLEPPSKESRPFVIAENKKPKSYQGVVEQMVRTEEFKYIWKSNDQHELYDLINDPEELHNIVLSEKHIAAELAQVLDHWREYIEDDEIELTEADYDETMLERLRELGYVE
jgi:arylsulfatase A-like enzyme